MPIGVVGRRWPGRSRWCSHQRRPGSPRVPCWTMSLDDGLEEGVGWAKASPTSSGAENAIRAAAHQNAVSLCALRASSFIRFNATARQTRPVSGGPPLGPLLRAATPYNSPWPTLHLVGPWAHKSGFVRGLGERSPEPSRRLGAPGRRATRLHEVCCLLSSFV